jgi:hypothetical protein
MPNYTMPSNGRQAFCRIFKIYFLGGLLRVSLKIQTVFAEYLLAMKLMSARYGEKDNDGILFLMRKLGISTSERAAEILR